MPRPRAVLALAAALAGLLILAGCHKDPPPAGLPDGATLIAQSAAAMKELQFAHIKIDTVGDIGAVPLRTAEGDLAKSGDAKGSIKLNAFGAVIELQFVVIGDDYYIKGITGGWQKASAADIATYYDPSAILDPDKGVSKVLTTATQARTEATETVNGAETYRISVALDSAAAAVVVPGVPAGTTGTVWIDQTSKRLVRAELHIPNTKGGDPGKVTINLTDLDKPVTFSAP